MIENWHTSVVGHLYMRHVHCASHPVHVINLLHVAQYTRIVSNCLFVAFKVDIVGFIEPYQGHKSLDVSHGESITTKVPMLAQYFFHFIKMLKQTDKPV